MLLSCAAKVVLFPSGASHLPEIVPPTPVANGVLTMSFGELSLKGEPKKPQTTPAFDPGGAGAWMCANVRLSLVSVVCKPVKSMLLIVAENDIEVMASLMTNTAVPNDAGRGAPVLVVGVVGGFSCPLVSVALRVVLAWAPALAASKAR